LKKRGNILVTGAGGQLGKDITAALQASGQGVIRYGREDLDITDRGAVLSAVKDAAPVVVINSAAYTKVDLAEKERERAFAVNEEGARNVALASKAAGAVLIHISTDFVFDGLKTSAYKEGDITHPLGVYGESKLAGEEAIRQSYPAHVIIRTSWLYGAGGNNFVKTILRLAGERDALQVVSDQIGSPTWTVDLGAVITQMAEAIRGAAPPPFGLYHYSNEGVTNWCGFARAIVEEAGALGVRLKCREVEPIPTTAYPTPAARPAYSVLDKTKIKKTLCLEIPHWRTSLTKMLMDFLNKEGKKHG